jgi:hypothetical protein
MVISAATGISLDFPPKLAAKDSQNATLIYRAIVDRKFDFPMLKYPLSVIATPAEFQQWKSVRPPASITVWEKELSLELLGKTLAIGTVKVVFRKAAISSFDEFLERLSAADFREVQTVISALDGRVWLECNDAPHLPPNSWTPEEDALVAIGPALCHLLADRYNSLAASTLEGLTDEEKAEITARPEFSDDAHVIRDED